MITTNNKKSYDQAALESMFSLGSLGKVNAKANIRPNTVDGMKYLTGFSAETVAGIESMLAGCKFEFNGKGFNSKVRFMQNLTGSQFALESLVEDCMGSKFTMLPEELKALLRPLQDQITKEKNSLAMCGTESTSFLKRKFNRRQEMAKNAMRKTLFNIFSRFKNRDLLMEGTEGYGLFPTIRQDLGLRSGNDGLESLGVSVPSAIYFPKLESAVQFPNATNTIYSRVIPQKQLLNDMTQIPVITELAEVGKIKDDGSWDESTTIRRDQLYSYFNHPDHLDRYEMLTRDLVMDSADFGKFMLLRNDVYTGASTPFLAGRELLKPEISLKNISYVDGTTPANDFESGEIYDRLAGPFAKMPAFNELDKKGKILYYYPAEADKANYFAIMIDFDIQRMILNVDINPVGAKYSKAKIENVTLGFKLHDVEFVQEVGYQVRFRQEEMLLKMPAEKRLQQSINPSENAIADERGGGSYLSKMTNLMAEMIGQDKDGIFHKQFMNIYDETKKQYDTSDVIDGVLFAHQTVNKRTEKEYRKMEAYGVYMSNGLNVLKTKLESAANTSYVVQLNGFTHQISLPAIQQVCSVITGDINETEDGKFIGVQKPEKTYMITLGTHADSPVDAIIVANNKKESYPVFMSEGGGGAKTLIPATEVEYDYWMVPTFSESNLNTVLFTETPTKIISSSDFRGANVKIPTLFMEYTAEVQVLRLAAAKLTVTGFEQDLA